jgi:hypothetical protein
MRRGRFFIPGCAIRASSAPAYPLRFRAVTEDTPSIPNLPGKAKGLVVGLRLTKKAIFTGESGASAKANAPSAPGKMFPGEEGKNQGGKNENAWK